MNKGLRITDDLTVTGQIRLEQIQQAIQEGFQSVLNLRSSDEMGFLKHEEYLVSSVGMRYVNIPLKIECIDEAVITEILQTIDQLPKPAIIHCGAGIRSTVIALLSTAIHEGLTCEQAFTKARNLGFHYVDCNMANPELKQRFSDYIAKYSRMATAL